MPYGEKSKYKHFRQLPPGRFDPKSFRIVPISHTEYKGEKFDKEGVKAIVGKLLRDGRAVQSILVPKRRGVR